ncbi:DUF4148 domain-containing protein [Bordetella petrii]|uniref:Secreted protein n=1 Tax=Bordetella petrii (strain ATCC BAA-461 / DSM 12804 / CCUG 43448 / CIP 107267 / Se-1111R) TaxID=340100 RepID=A9IF26_BORPD|nr:DUF4148 domain-containing protein [Bordetella petrii]CAP44948.1 hypothetical protein Bpet4597 [Bordetella petrii]
MKNFLKYLPLGLALISMQSAIAGSASTSEKSAFAQDAELSRAEVQADLAIWKRAGMDKFWRGNQTPNTFSREYRMAQAEYQRMRNGTEYQQELQRRTQ